MESSGNLGMPDATSKKTDKEAHKLSFFLTEIYKAGGQRSQDNRGVDDWVSIKIRRNNRRSLRLANKIALVCIEIGTNVRN